MSRVAGSFSGETTGTTWDASPGRTAPTLGLAPLPGDPPIL